MEAFSARCNHLARPSAFNTTLAAVLVAGILFSYLPQHIKIIRQRTSEGLSHWWVLLGALSSITALGNIVTLPASRADVACCKEISGGACAAALLGVAQIGIQWMCFMFIVMLFLIFFPAKQEQDSRSPTAPHRRDAILVGSATLLALLVTGIVSLALVAAYPQRTQAWADVLGSISGVLAMIQYVPQIYHTYRLSDIKSLSIATMLIQAPGAFLFAFSLWQRVGWEGWSTWLVYVVTGLLQGVLLGLAVYFHVTNRKARKAHDDDGFFSATVDDVDGAAVGAEDVDERTALLSNGRKGSTKSRPITSTQRSDASQRQLGMLYAATPPEHDSDRSSSGRGP
ncbi:hypothetical protein BAUCODRAFT_39026 [Baudoinia panamericana UAMH 10762]|uniref:PQ loop repeat protein n=1 Tax=Baudoinia panamericana (strain UAMH 10762) TaxID=717646 RepID=M2M5H9_BAUPA|nr:uncharacterized protein BAUCODRAFT_39026 [Baudoinia panamericana UAMH 10762]EMC91881.1 hypothetical protein BAUCODRAFT_39026 [Baudoinia panamericana UAMH 10762]